MFQIYFAFLWVFASLIATKLIRRHELVQSCLQIKKPFARRSGRVVFSTLSRRLRLCILNGFSLSASHRQKCFRLQTVRFVFKLSPDKKLILMKNGLLTRLGGWFVSRSASNDCVIGLARNLARIREVFEVNSAENCAKKAKRKVWKFSHREVLVESCATGMRERHRMEHWNDKKRFWKPPFNLGVLDDNANINMRLWLNIGIVQLALHCRLNFHLRFDCYRVQ